ncbi:unnamed protein product [Phaedon cochleariae]|uniref:Uncharacterized protein n=1 Tax=Phaedon cochleariae TaxID=80249 RepID=A0A9P0DR45_PHACE|nr:unnamed protein product [Phaedon cochleariae]
MKKEIKYNVNWKILTLAFVGFVMVCFSCFMYVYDPLQMIIRRLVSLTPGSMLFTIWSNPPYDVVMKLYVFNVTNPEEFLRGEEKLNVQQLGPYAYKELLTNQNSTFHDDGTVTYTPRRDFPVDAANSIGDARTDRIIVPNIPMIGIQSYLKDASFITNIGFSTISTSLGAQSFMNLTVEEYLWGYEDKLVSVANKFIPSWIDFGKFGIMERLMNRDNTNQVTISSVPGKTHSPYEYLLTDEEKMAEFHIVKWNGSPGLKDWGFDDSEEAISTTKKCHLVEGAFDGTVFPKPLRKNRTLTLFRKAFCRPVDLTFVEESTTAQGFRSYNYKLNNNMFASPEINPANECFCRNGECPGKGLQNIGVCYYDIPIVLSQPHFLNGAPEVINAISGMNPSEELHSGIAKIHPDLGVPLDESTLKVQVNLGVGKTKYNSKTRPFNDLTLPLLWIELDCMELPKYIAFLITLVVDVLPVCQNVLIYLLGSIGLAMVSGAALLTLFFSKTMVPRSMSIASEYSPIPIINIPSHYFKEKELRICK